MKKLAFALALAGVLAACNVTVVPPGPAPGTPVTVDDDTGASAAIAPSQKKRFELTVAAQPVRLDVYHDEAAGNGELTVKVFDSNDTAYAYTNRRDIFAKAGASLSSLGLTSQDISLSFPYSINLPKNMDKVYVEVTNNTSVVASVTVKAVTRNEVVRENASMEAPSGNATSVNYGGAILFLGQHDTYTYTDSASGKTITFSTADPDNSVGITAVLNPGQPSETILQPGVAIQLVSGDKVEVQARDDARAGFCNTSKWDCADDIVSGEYTLTIQ
jgi:hypothetical protein